MRILLCVISSLWLVTGAAQQQDRVWLYSDVFLSTLPMTVGGVTDLADSGVSGTVGSSGVPSEPRYGFEETSSTAVRFGAHLNLKVPILKKSNFSLGFNFSFGGGMQVGVKNADGLNTFVLDFPQYVYFRSVKRDVPHSIMLGYRWSIGGLRMKNPVLAWEVQSADGGIGFRLNATLLSQKYYMNDQHGTLTPIFKGNEYGGAFIIYF